MASLLVTLIILAEDGVGGVRFGKIIKISYDEVKHHDSPVKLHQMSFQLNISRNYQLISTKLYRIGMSRHSKGNDTAAFVL